MAWQSSQRGAANDVLVLGATVAGLTTAIEVARAGGTVTVLDPSHATRFGLGLLTVGQGSTLREIELHRGAAAVTTYVDWTRRAVDWLRLTLPAHGVTITDHDAYELCVDGHLAFHLVQEKRLLRLAGEEVDIVDEVPLPLAVRPALYLPHQASLDSWTHRTALTDIATSLGVHVVRDVQLGRFVRRHGWEVRYHADGASSTVTAADVVDSLGASPWGDVVLDVSTVVHPIVEAEGDCDEIHTFVDTPAALVYGSRGFTVVIGQPVSEVRERPAAADLVGWVTSQLKRQVTKVRARYAEVTADRVPVVGAIPILRGAWVARGFGLYETTSATAAGLQLAEALVSGGAQPWAPLRVPTGPLAAWRRWAGRDMDPMVGVPSLLARRGLG
ncbi:MAG TPA: FAD-binding oxidoreductase [Propionibacteriaceae bacterium]|nr:FAD-binding oxidoreductase [Propionibacteriaceae bacterium]